jgi:cytochrome c-type biogenesis protein
MSFDLPGLFAAGLLTFLSPCILPLLPLYLSFLGGTSVAQLRAGEAPRRLWASALAFCLGLSAVFIALGLAATALGRALSTHRALLLQLGGAVVLLFGLKALGLLKLPWLEREVRPGMARLQRHGGLLGGFLFGAAFALGWTPCVGPVLGSVLTFTASTASGPLEGALYLAVYAAGLSLPLLAVAGAAPWALRQLERVKQHLPLFEKATGALLVGLALLLLTDNLGLLVPATTPQAEAPVAEALPAPSPTLADALASGPEEALACDSAAAEGACGVSEEALQAAAAQGAHAAPPMSMGPGMVQFTSRSCPVCQRMKPTVATTEANCSGQHAAVTHLDVSTPQGAALAARHGVRGVPTYLFLDARGAEVARLIGAQSLATLQGAFQSATGQACRE